MEPRTSLNSIQQSFPGHTAFAKARPAAVAETVEFFRKTRPTFFQYYCWLADIRNELAYRTSAVFCSSTPKYEVFGLFGGGCVSTLISDRSLYQDFYPDLVRRYHAMRNTLPVVKNTGYNKLLERKPYYVNKIIGTPEYICISYEGIVHTRLMGIHALTYDDNKIFYIHIVSNARVSGVLHLDIFIRRLEPLYDKICGQLITEAERIHLMKHMIWHMAHLMILMRGSAAASEIGIEGLCLAHGINYTHPEGAIPLDLLALFTPDPEIFANSVVIANETIPHCQHNHQLSTTSIV